jgi:hypothetical protein
LFPCLSLHSRSLLGARVADKLEDDVHAYEHRIDQPTTTLFSTFGSAGLGFDLSSEAWPNLTQAFSSGSDKAFHQCPGQPSCPSLPPVERLPKDCLEHAPADLLVLGDLSPARLVEWRNRIPNGSAAPKLILEFWETYWAVKATGRAQLRSGLRRATSRHAGQSTLSKLEVWSIVRD